VQVHGAAVAVANAGERVALNLAGLEVTAVQRGMAVVRAQELPEARVLDVELELLAAALGPLPRRTRALVALGTAQVETQVRLIEVDALRPGETAFAQLRLSAPVAALPGQRFILRGTRALPGRGATIGGGRVLAVNPPRRRRASADTLRALASSGLDERVTLLLTEAGYAGLTEKALFARASASAKELARTLATLSSAGKVALVDKDERRYLAEDVRRALAARAVVLLDTYYSTHPDADAMPREELKSRLGVPHERTFQRLLTSLVDAGQAQVAEDLVKLPGRGRTVTQAGQAARAQVARKLAEAALQPPTPPELARTLSLPQAAVETALAALVADGAAVRAGELTFDAAAVQGLQVRLVAFLEEKGSISTQAFKDLVGLSRKYVIPLAEYFDAHKVTLRVGENRTLRRGAGER
jgi:selenocysteine-specific elongation factor